MMMKIPKDVFPAIVRYLFGDNVLTKIDGRILRRFVFIINTMQDEDTDVSWNS